MAERVLITGGAGFIGSHTADILLERGYDVRVLDNLEPQVHGALEGPPDYLSRDVEFLRGDVRSPDDLARALRDVDVVIHDAAMVGVGQSQYDVARYTDVNVMGTVRLIEALRAPGLRVRRMLVASSMSIYGEGACRNPKTGAVVSPGMRAEKRLAAGDFELYDPQTGDRLDPIPTPESKPLECTSIYALNKKDQEEYCLLAGRLLGIPVIACRFFNVYGPRQSLSNPYTGVCAIFSSRIKNGNRPLVYEDGAQSRDFIHVRDIAAAKLFLLEHPDAAGVYNLCTGRATSIADISRELARLLGRPELEPDVTRAFRAGDIRHCFGDGARLAALGWKPTFTLEQGLADLVAWSENVAAEDRVEQAHRELMQHRLVRE